MSILIEAVSLVVPRRLLWLRYPGGVDGFFAELSRPSAENRHVCSDIHLIGVSFYTREAAERTGAVLISAGLIESRNGAYVDFAIVDQKDGPLLDCPWIELTAEPGGYSCAWLADAERGELAVPAGWTPEQSRRLSRFDSGSSLSDTLKLSDENGVETWLDLRTGRIGRREKLRTH